MNFSLQSFNIISVYFSLFICHWEIHEKNKKKINYLDSHGEEAQKKPAGFWRMGSLR